MDSLTQKDVDSVWSEVWEKNNDVNTRSVFSHRLFIEGYTFFHPYIPKQTESILEVGTGSGRYAVAFARDFPEARVVATDIVQSSLSLVEELGRVVGVKNLSVHHEDAEALSYEDNSFDVVFSDAVLQHVPNEEKMVSEMARVAKPGGMVIISSVNARSLHFVVRFIRERIFRQRYSYGIERMYTKTRLQELAKRAGLTVETISGFYPAYGIYRLKNYWRGYAAIGRALNRITRFVDRYTHSYMSKHFGFELALIAKKPLH